MQKTKVKRCPKCGSISVVKWGKQRGYQRYKCKSCGSHFTWRRKDVSEQNRFVWFKWWILGKQTIKQISVKSGYSEKSLRLLIDRYLHNYPKWKIQFHEKVNLLIDGTFFANKVCLVVYRDNNIKETLFYRITDGEWEDELTEDINNILSLGIEIESVTCDGSHNIIKAVRKSCPTAILQRCVVHVQRECLIWLTRNPQSEAGIELRKIVCRLHKITTREEWGYWVVSLVRWEEQYRTYLAEKSYKEDPNRYWFTHKMVRKSFVHIRHALPDMFHYLDNPRIPKHTNSLESFFGHLKENVSLHRGLSKMHYQNYVKWYLYFRNQEQNSTKK